MMQSVCKCCWILLSGLDRINICKLILLCTLKVIKFEPQC